MLKPLGDRVVLKVEEKEQKVGGFVIAGNGQAATKTAEVVAVGQGIRTLNGELVALSVKEGDKVTLAGKDGSEEILIDDLAALAGTFNYEFVCDLGKRVPRVFVKDGKIVGTKDYFEDDYEVEI